MSYGNAALLLVVFFVFYKFVVPWLFPSVVSGEMHVKARAKKNDDASETTTNEITVTGSVMTGLAGARTTRAHAKAEIRKRNAGAKDDMS